MSGLVDNDGRGDEGAGTMEPYTTSLEHVLAELDRVSLLLRLATSGLPGGGEDGGHPPPASEGAPSPSALEKMIQEISARRSASAAAGVPLRLPELARSFGLSGFEVDALLLSLLPEIDLGFERLYAQIQQSASRRWPSVDLVLWLLCPSLEARVVAQRRFAPGAPLVRHGILRLVTDAPDLAPPLLAHLVRVDPRIAAHLLGSDEIDPEIESFARFAGRPDDRPPPDASSEIGARLRRFVERTRSDEAGPGAIVYLQGPYGSGKRSTAEALCRDLGMKLLAVDGATLGAEEASFRTLARRCGREATLQGAAVYWGGVESLLTPEKPLVQAAFLDAIEEHPGLVILAGKRPWEPTGPLSRRDFIRVEMPRPSAAEQSRRWQTELARSPGVAAAVDVDALTSSYKLSGGQIRDAAATARSLALFRSPGEPVSQTDLYDAARLHSSRGLTTMGRRISPSAAWGDLVLPAEQEERLREICAHVRHRGRVMDTWGFDCRLTLGKGVSALFSGPPGTGKTFSAGVMARELGLDLYHVDLSAVLSKYMGETEQHLSQLFDEAESSNAILFFDEADTLFGKRTEVKDAHDRNANLQASYMLQRIEAYEGVAILASNFTKNMDEAFVRRLRFIVEFPFPSEAERRRIWERALPAEAPRAADLDLDFLARQIDLSGGYIRNIALRAAFLAASRGDVIRMRHVLCAARWEYQKMGKVVEYARFAHPAAREEQR
ncbi:MAG: ATP-binding protein [Minicystis sp.]